MNSHPTEPPIRGVILSNGAYSTGITHAGTGFSTFRDTALTFWAGDPTEDADGFFVYLRDLETGELWSAGLMPVLRRAEHYEADRVPGGFAILRRDRGIETRMEIRVPSDLPLEIRTLRLRNLGDRVRFIEITTYLEVVLHNAAAHASHPVFSKLFIQTEYDSRAGALLARRRPREAGETPLWMVHAATGARIVAGGATPENGAEYETDRVRFIGRGRGKRNPLALALALPADPPRFAASTSVPSTSAPSAGQLSGTTGNVLDPILSLRRAFVLEPGEEVACAVLLGAGRDRADALGLVSHLDEVGREQARVAGIPRIPAPSAARITETHGDADRSPIAQPEAKEPLLFFNGTGGFSIDGREYVMRIRAQKDGTLRLPPRPWTNVIANPRFGFLISEAAVGCTWSGNSRLHRLTPWSNDPLLDPPSEAFYLRDEETGDVCSLLTGIASDPEADPPASDATSAPPSYEVRHGFGYTAFRGSVPELDLESTHYVARDDPIKLVRVRVRNRGERARRLSLLAYERWVLGDLPEKTATTVTTEITADRSAVFARNPAAEAWEKAVAFAAAYFPHGAREFRAVADRAGFLGPHGSADHPAALAKDAPLTAPLGVRPATPLAVPPAVRSGSAFDSPAVSCPDPCAVQQVFIDLGPGETIEGWFLLGEGASLQEAEALLARYRNGEAAEGALRLVDAFWVDALTGVQIRTPSRSLDLMVNGWLLYQTLSCRLWGRTAFYQSGGAYGYRDQLQDSLAWISTDPGRTREQILLHAGHQFVEGDVLHWWNPPLDWGLRTRFADDLLWLPFATTAYVSATGDRGIFDATAPFVQAPPLEPGRDETYLRPASSGESGDLYDHCCRAIDRSLRAGAHGLPLFGTGDWNDGMNRVGREGRGESVWMAFFLSTILDGFLPFCRERGDTERAERYAAAREGFLRAANEGGWDGSWYRRGYYDDGSPLGSSQDEECRIDALAQAWSILSGAASLDRARQAMDEVERQLISDEEGLIRLLRPPFENTPHDPGYIKGYVRGVRENGGQYTHAALWVVQATALLGRNNRAAPLLDLLNPIHHARSEEEVSVYQIEPYVVAADVYGEPPHVGKGGWTWYTGSAGWMFRVALESILGFGVEDGETIRMKPCVPDGWTGFSIDFRPPGGGTRYEIVVKNSDCRARSVIAATLDGGAVRIEDGAARVPILRDGRAHRMELTLG